MNAILNADEWAMIREALNMYRDELDAQWEANAPASFVRPDLGLTAEDEVVADNCRAVEALLKALPATGPVTIVSFVSPAREQVAA